VGAGVPPPAARARRRPRPPPLRASYGTSLLVCRARRAT